MHVLPILTVDVEVKAPLGYFIAHKSISNEKKWNFLIANFDMQLST